MCSRHHCAKLPPRDFEVSDPVNVVGSPREVPINENREKGSHKENNGNSFEGGYYLTMNS